MTTTTLDDLAIAIVASFESAAAAAAIYRARQRALNEEAGWCDRVSDADRKLELAAGYGRTADAIEALIPA